MMGPVGSLKFLMFKLPWAQWIVPVSRCLAPVLHQSLPAEAPWQVAYAAAPTVLMQRQLQTLWSVDAVLVAAFGL